MTLHLATPTASKIHLVDLLYSESMSSLRTHDGFVDVLESYLRYVHDVHSALAESIITVGKDELKSSMPPNSNPQLPWHIGMIAGRRGEYECALLRDIKRCANKILNTGATDLVDALDLAIENSPPSSPYIQEMLTEPIHAFPVSYWKAVAEKIPKEPLTFHPNLGIGIIYQAYNSLQ